LSSAGFSVIYSTNWIHTKPWLMLVFGGFGFYAGIREVLRRLPGSNKDSPRCLKKLPAQRPSSESPG